MPRALLTFLKLTSLITASSAFILPPSNNQINNEPGSRLQQRHSSSSLYTNTAVSNLINEAKQSQNINDEEQQQQRQQQPKKEKNVRIILPGGGIFFYWQAGAVSYLREAGYDLSKTTASGASAGALAATLALTDVDFEEATSLALKLAEEAGVWERPLGLQGVWGPMIEEWLNELLPENAVEMVDERLSLLVTSVPSFRRVRICSFDSKDDLVKCNMASVHLPWFLDGKLTSNFRQSPHIDGSFRAKPNDYFPDLNGKTDKLITLNWKSDPIMEGKAKDFITLTSKEGIWGLLEQGRSYAKIMEKRGDFDAIARL